MAQVKIILFKSKALSDGKHPIMIRVTHLRKRKYFATGFKCRPNQWNTDFDRFDKGYKKRTAHNNILNAKQSKANKIIESFDNEDRPFSFEVFERKFKGINQRTTLFKFFDQHIKTLKNSTQEGYADVFQATLNSIKKYRKEKDLKLFDVDYKFLKGYEDYLNSRNLKTNSIFVYFRTLRTLV
ncbi:phage integrase SAM-like domain and Arm DNA-binding domain-containing protein, partial [Bacteroidota bacterium]